MLLIVTTFLEPVWLNLFINDHDFGYITNWTLSGSRYLYEREIYFFGSLLTSVRKQILEKLEIFSVKCAFFT